MFKKIRQNRMYEEIAEQILEGILRGDLKTGSKLPSEKELGDMFGVSRVTVREAILSLEHRGLVEVRQGSRGGSYIKEMDLDTVVRQVAGSLRMANVTFPHLSEARAFLEETALSRMMPKTIRPEVIERLRKNTERAQIHYENGENKERLITNFRFHTLIIELTSNPILVLMHKLIVELSLPFFEKVEPTKSMIEKTLEDHREVISLFKKGKIEEAGMLCGGHIRGVSRRIMEKSKRQSPLSTLKKS